MVNIKYRKNIYGNIIVEIIDNDRKELEVMREKFVKQNAPTFLQSYNDWEGSWVVGVQSK